MAQVLKKVRLLELETLKSGKTLSNVKKEPFIKIRFRFENMETGEILMGAKWFAEDKVDEVNDFAKKIAEQAVLENVDISDQEYTFNGKKSTIHYFVTKQTTNDLSKILKILNEELPIWNKK